MFRSLIVTRTSALPVDAMLPEILASLDCCSNLVLEAPPGAGKTTRVPPALLQRLPGQILVLEPRRIAARLAARRVALEMGEQVGETVGYQVRFDESVGPRTRLRFVTEGILTRRLLSDPLLEGIDAVVLDEFHERHLESDLALALLRRLQQRRPALQLLVMSATLDVAPIARFLGHCPILRSPGRLFPVSLEHLPYSPLPLEQRVLHAVEQLLRQQHDGSILVFLPGAAEIRRAMRVCEPVARQAGLLLLPLHGDLSPAEQDRAVTPTPQRKLILATNVAESSITVEGVTAVIDSGLARIATYSQWTGLPTLAVSRVSQASAKQRAGRAGRTAPGQVLRLYPEEDYLLRPAYDAPEIARTDLAQLSLTLRAIGVSARELAWLDPPPPGAIALAEALLDRLGATDDRAAQLARYPLAPRLARLLVDSMDRGVGEVGCLAAALLGSGARSPHGDLLAALDAPQDARTLEQSRQLLRLARPRQQDGHDDIALLLSVLAGFPDRVGRVRAGSQALLCSGGAAEFAGEPPPYEFFVALDIEDRQDKPLPLIRMTARIEREWLLDLFADLVSERSQLTWNEAAERVESVSALLYDELVIEESRGGRPEANAAAALLAEKALEAGAERFLDAAELESLLARAAFAGLAPPDLQQALETLCAGLRSFAELRAAAPQLLPLLAQQLGAGRLQALAPTTLRLQAGRQTKVHYERGKPPWISSRLQDFFGMRETPQIGPNRIPVVVHLLAPNHRPVQTTTDLAGFWERLYPELRRSLMRRYPRHAWPERP